MIEPVRKDVLEVLSELSRYTPEVRFGQLICNLALMARSMEAGGIWDMEDDELLAVAKEHLEMWRANRPALAQSA